MQAVLNRVAAGAGMGEGMRELTNHLFRGDARFTWGSPLDYVSLSVTDVRRWMEPSLARGYVEVTIAGDVAEAAVVDAVGCTLGALRSRASRKETAAAPRPVALSAPAGFTRIEFIGEQNMGLVIGMFLRDQPKQRPLTHDLINSIFKGFNITVERAIITEEVNSTYYARLVLQQNNELGRKLVEIDARPSDCLALACAQKRPIYVSKTLWNEVDDSSSLLDQLNENGGGENE